MSGMALLDVVIVSAFDCTTSTRDWSTVNHDIYWMVQEKLKQFPDSCLGYTYVMSTGNTCTSEMKKVDPLETEETGYQNSYASKRTACSKNMAAGLTEAHKMIGYRGHWNAIILLFSDGLINQGNFFDGAQNYISKVPVYTFTLGGDAYNHVLQAIAKNSPGGTFMPTPVPSNPSQWEPFTRELDNILNGAMHPSNKIERFPLNVVMVYAFDCTTWTTDWYKLDQQIFPLVHDKLTHFQDSYLGHTYVMSTHNTYTHDMIKVDSSETWATGFKCSPAWSRKDCVKNMASGLSVAHEMINSRPPCKTIILLFSDGLINKGDFFDGAVNFKSSVPVYTFTLGGDEYNHDLLAIAENSPGGMFIPSPVPDLPLLSVPFSRLLDDILNDNKRKIIDDRNNLYVPKGLPNPLVGQIGDKPASMSFTYFQAITDNFNVKRILGEGAFGVVYRGVQENGGLVAVKKVLQQDDDTEEQFESEIDLLMKLKHQNVVQLLGYYYGTQNLHEGKKMLTLEKQYLICLEFMPGGSLRKHITDASSRLHWHKRYNIIVGISKGLRYLHEQSEPIMHLDLKPENILLDRDMQPKITDFGLSRFTDQHQTIHTKNISGTVGYMSPEVQQGKEPSIESDIFSLGVIIIEVITGHKDYPYMIKRESKEFIEQELTKWRNRLQEEPAYASLEKDCQEIERCIQIGLICLNKDKDKRPNMKKILDLLQGSEDSNMYITNELSEDTSNLSISE